MEFNLNSSWMDSLVISKKIIKFRRCLEKNKIFFEIFSSFLIGGASLVVSYSALSINDKMLAATEVSALPHLSIGSRARIDKETQKYAEEELFISNNGAPLSNLDWRTKTFIVVESAALQRPYILLPVNGYYFTQFSTSNVVGELSSKLGHNNMQKFASFYSEVVDHNNLQLNPLDYYFVRIVTVSRVEYLDRLGQRGVVYFRDNTKISETSARPLWDYEAIGRMQDIDSLRFEELKAAASAPNALMLDELP
ncbi:hypothetical protein [Pseudomonas sp. NPDC087690]|uniref:hypothetical protein n=1 Tax=Pseudomonas sp. NPDC087690 TaxID=3364446 RepID=UPI00380651E9